MAAEAGTLEDAGAPCAAPVVPPGERAALRLAACCGAAQPVCVEVEILKNLIGEEMRVLIREELANIMERHGDSTKSERALCPDLPRDDGELCAKADPEEYLSDGSEVSYQQNGVRYARSETGLSGVTSFSALAESSVAFSSFAIMTKTAFRNIYAGWGVAEPPERSDCLSKIADSWQFVAFNDIAIIVSLFILGFEANQAVLKPGSVGIQPAFFVIFEMVLLAIFLVELFVNIWRWGSVFFYGERLGTHWLDVLVVVLGVATVTQFSTLTGGFPASKVVRLLRISKVLRVFRFLTAIKPLRVILKCLQSSLTVLFSAITFLSLTLYMFAVVFSLGVMDFVAEHGDNITDTESVELVSGFGSVGASMFSLLVSTTDSWGGSFRILKPTGSFYPGLLVAFVLFTQLALLNIILGMFVDVALKAMTVAPEDVAEEQAQNEQKQEEDIKKMLKVGAVTNEFQESQIDKRAWEKICGDGKIFSYLESIGLRRRHVQKWFRKCLKHSEDGMVDARTFAKGCMRFKGTASCFDVHALRWDMKQLMCQKHGADSSKLSRP